MNQEELAIKALGMQRDYTNSEIAQLLGVRLEDLTAAIEAHKAGKTGEVKEDSPVVPKSQTRKKTTPRLK